MKLFLIYSVQGLVAAMGVLAITAAESSRLESATDRAITEARTMTQQNVSRVSSWVALGDALAQKQRDTLAESWYEEAEEAYSQALEIEKECVAALNGLAWVYGGRHLFVESVKWAKKALEIDAGNSVAYGIVGDAALELGDLERAFESYQKMMDLRPDLSAYSRGGYLVWLTGDSKKGRWLMQKAIEMGSSHAENTAWCRSRLAMMLFHEGAMLPAAQVAEEGLERAPGHIPLLMALGKVKEAQKDDSEALAAYEAVLNQGDHLGALVAIGDLHAVAGRTEEAERFYRRVEALHEANVANGIHDHSIIAKFYADHDRKLDRALALAKEHLNSQNVYEVDLLGWAYFKNGEYEAARKCMERVLKVQTPDAELLYHAGMIAEATGDKTGGRKLLSRAMSMNPGFSVLGVKVVRKKLSEMGGGLAME